MKWGAPAGLHFTRFLGTCASSMYSRVSFIILLDIVALFTTRDKINPPTIAENMAVALFFATLGGTCLIWFAMRAM
jgi:hypothetical protein